MPQLAQQLVSVPLQGPASPLPPREAHPNFSKHRPEEGRSWVPLAKINLK